jgi:hypothetical protein
MWLNCLRANDVEEGIRFSSFTTRVKNSIFIEAIFSALQVKVGPTKKENVICSKNKRKSGK